MMLLILNRPNYNQYVGLPQHQQWQQQQPPQPPPPPQPPQQSQGQEQNQHVKFNTKVSFITILMNLSVLTCAQVS